MPTLITTSGTPVEVAPLDSSAVNAQFRQAMDDDGPDEHTPPERPETPSREGNRPRRGRPPKTEKARTVATAPAALDDRARSTGVKGWAQIAGSFAIMAGKATGDGAFYLDAVVIASNADALADACVNAAHADPKFAAVLDKVCNVGPYGALVSVVVGIGAQCLRNHKPQLQIPGTVDPAQLLNPEPDPVEE